MDAVDPQLQREFAVEIVRRLRASGYDAVWAGGCVRDALLGRVPKDYDVATSARPDEIRALFGPRRTIAVGAAFGVIAVWGPKGAGQIDVVTFRQDAAYSDGRHPDAVTFSTAEADAQRRDFTINGLFFDPTEERVIDFVGGQADLAAGVVRAIGEPAARFAEDKLRLLRAVRFAATLVFALEPNTRRAAEAMAREITVVSAERIATELRLMLTHARRRAAVELLDEMGLLTVLAPELASLREAGEESAWFGTLATLDALERPSFPLALAALFVELDGTTVEQVAERWKLSNFERERASWLVEHRDSLARARHLAWSQLQPLLVAPGNGDLLALERARAASAGRDSAQGDYCQQKLLLPADVLDPAPLVTGDDLVSHGVPRGPRYKVMLDAVRAAQLDGRIQTKEEALAWIDSILAQQEGETSIEGESPRESE